MKSSTRLIFLFLLTYSTLSQSRRGSESENLKIIDSLLKNYDRREIPSSSIGTSTEVTCSVHIGSLGPVSETTMDFHADLYLKQSWSDPRLNHSQIVEVLDLNDPRLVQGIWKPEVYFPNAKTAGFQFVTMPNLLIRINPGGQIEYMLRLDLTFSCLMQLSKYPMDDQICTIQIASFSKTMQDLQLKWGQAPVDLTPKLEMLQFHVESIDADTCENSVIDGLFSGKYSCLEFKMHLKRKFGFHLVHTYLPTFLLVVVSWLSFWMDVEQVTPRIVLCITTLLIVSSKSAGLGAESLQGSYIRAIDIWMGICNAFIVGALIEFLVVNYVSRKSRNVSTEKLAEEEPEKKENGRKEILLATTIDMKCQFVFPILFLLFTCVYWFYYLIIV